MLIGIKTTVTPSEKIPTPSWSKNAPPLTEKATPFNCKNDSRGSQHFKIRVLTQKRTPPERVVFFLSDEEGYPCKV